MKFKLVKLQIKEKQHCLGDNHIHTQPHSFRISFKKLRVVKILNECLQENPLSAAFTKEKNYLSILCKGAG